MIKRIWKFDNKDWNHIRFLFKNLFVQALIKFNWHETKETCWWIRIHLSYDSERVEKE